MKFFGDKLPSLDEIEAQIAGQSRPDAAPLRITVLRNVTVEAIEPYLRYFAAEIGRDAEIRFGDHDAIFQQAAGGAPELFEACDAVLLFTPFAALSPMLADRFAALTPEAIEQEIAFCAETFRTVVAGIRRQTDAMLLWHGLEPPIYPALGIHDAQRALGQAAVVHRLNEALRAALAETGNAWLVDMTALAMRLGANAFYDLRYWHIARSPWSRAGLAEIAHEDFKFIRALAGRARKCLVLDCDNTLWGGIIGEDGLEGIRLGPDYPGSPYHELQRTILDLHARGVILALCSKNNEADVWEVFDRHPQMLLKREHVAAWRINWQDKAANIRALAAELNIGLDSLVFADDNLFEIDLIRAELPEVATLHVDARRPADARWQLAACGHFDLPGLTEEDRQRGALYRAERERSAERGSVTDLAGYCRSLAITLEIRLANSGSIARIAQQTQKTNQFNLTTRRYGEAEIASLAAAADSDVLSCRVADRYGDMGIVGTCVIRYRDGDAVLDTFLLSCRALGRGIEKRFLAEVLQRARQRGAQRMIADYLPTAKNGQVEPFLPDAGFALLSREADGSARFAFDLADPVPQAGDWFAAVDVAWAA